MSRGLANYRGDIYLREAIQVQRELVDLIKNYCKKNDIDLEKKILHIHRVKQFNHDKRWKLLKNLKNRFAL